jgi:serine/threonine protein kinase
MIESNTIVGGRYRVVKPLGGGGMKLVYLAEDLRLAARRCALAEVVDNFTDPNAQRQAITAFEREADMLARLSNEHIPRVFDRFSEQNHHYLVMEYIDGVTLEEELKRAGGRMPEARMIDIALQILDTLTYLHGLLPPVIYRDLKPSNVMLTAGGQAKLIDFGIARHFQPLQNATMIGTQGYAPPEQYRGKVEQRSDLFALGATIHHSLSGRDPANEAPFSFPPLRTLCPGVAPALATLIDESLAYDVDRRPPSAADFRSRLEAIRDGVEHEAGPAAGTAANASSGSNDAHAAGSARAQLRLPLGAGGTPASAGPTLLSASHEMPCPKCARAIPSDSHFCSFCGADLAMEPQTNAPVSHEAETVVLSVPPPPRPRSVPPGVLRYQRARSMRRPVLVLVLIFMGAFAAVRAVSCMNQSGESSPDTSRAVTPPPVAAPAVPANPDYSGTPPPASEFRTARLAAFREALNMRGYTGVQFRMVGDTMQLWGTVPDELDPPQVEVLAMSIVGVVSFDARGLRVQDSSGGP